MAIVTKSGKVEQGLRELIYSGKLKPGQQIPPERELLHSFGVSRSALRDALSALSTDGLIDRRHGAGTYVSKKALKKGTISVLAKFELLCKPSSFVYQDYMRFARKFIESSNHRFGIVVGHGDTPSEFISSVNIFDHSIAKDTIGVLSTLNMGAIEAQLDEAGIKSVSIVAAAPTSRYCVVLDYISMIRMGRDIFEANGYKDFSILEVGVGDPDEVDKVVSDALRNTSRDVVNNDSSRIIKVQENYTYNEVYDLFLSLKEDKKLPRALLIIDDTLCEMVFRAARELRIEIPSDMAVLTHANTTSVFHYPKEISRLEFDPEKIVSMAWEMLTKVISGQFPPQPVIYVAPLYRKGQTL